MKYKLIVLYLAFSVISLSKVQSQNFTFKSYTTAEGLTHNNVRAMIRDSTGFLWAATWDGLSRFDGHGFRNYYHIAKDTTSLPFFSIYNLALDKYNNLWLLTDWMQLVRYSRKADNFMLYRRLDTISLENIRYVNTDYAGNLWIIKNKELVEWDHNKNKGTVYRLKSKNGSPYIINQVFYEVYPQGDSIMWLTGPLTLKFRVDGNKDLILDKTYHIVRKEAGRPIDFDIKFWYRLFISEEGSKWILSNTGLFLLDEKLQEFREFRQEVPVGEFRGKPYFCWGWRYGGIYILDSQSHKLTHISSNFTNLPVNILPDSHTSLWLSSFTQTGVAQGLKYIILTPRYFHNYLITDKDSASPAVYAVAMDRYNNILAGIRGFDHIVKFSSDGKESGFDRLSPAVQNTALHVRSIFPTEKGIWIGYFGNLIQFYDYSSGKFQDFNLNKSSGRTILPAGDNRVYIGDTNFKLFDKSSGKTDILWRSKEEGGFYRIYMDSKGILWGGLTASRLFLYDTIAHKGSIIRLPVNKCNVEDIIEGKSDDIWIALLGEGVCNYNTYTGETRFYTTSDGLSNNTTYNLLKDSSGNIWVSTNMGISRINPESGKIRTFGPNDGLEISEFNSGAKFISPSGEFMFGGMGGFVSFFPDSISNYSSSHLKQRILLTGFEISGSKHFLAASLEQTDTIILPKGNDNFHFSFSSTDFINADNTLFRYRLSGINKDWIETSSRNRNINYTNLNPGWYVLTIEATDNNGEWSAKRDITIRVSPVFYETLFFIIMVILLLLSAITLSIVFYVRNVKQKERQKQDQFKLQSLQGQMNPHFIFNSLNSINYFISNNDRLSANRYIADFSRLIRSILANMGNNFIPFNDEISSIEDYLRIEHLRFADKFDYGIDISQVRNRESVEVCPGIMQPFIENAIWHGVRPLENRKGFISIKLISLEDDGIRCLIEDDGVGRTMSVSLRSYSENHRSRGISLAAERLQIMGKMKKTSYRLEITDLHPESHETGTKVEVDIPAIKTEKDHEHKYPRNSSG